MIKANRLENELRQSRQESAGALLRDLIGVAYVQANQKNFGLASETISRFFGSARHSLRSDPCVEAGTPTSKTPAESSESSRRVVDWRGDVDVLGK
jgi:hypothetical protein